MRHIRAVVRLVLIIVVTLILYILWLIGYLFCFGSEQKKEVVRYRIVRSWAKSVTAIMGMKKQILGTPPSAPFCLVSNHLSYVDILLFLTQIRGVLISRADVRRWPAIGHLAYMSGAIFINRALAKDVVRVNELIAGVLSRDQGVLFFPEATSTRGAEVGPFRSSLLAYPAETGLPVHYATIRYEGGPNDPPASETICWWGGMSFADHFYNLLTIPRFEALIHFGAAPVVSDDRKDLANQLRNRVVENFTPVIQAYSS